MTKETFKEIFDLHFDEIRRYVFYRCGDKDLSTDIAQDVFLKVWEKQLISDPKSVKGLLYKIAGDLFVNQYRHKLVEQKYMNSFTLNQDDISPEDVTVYNEMKLAYEKALGQLSEKQRTVFLMSRIDRMKYGEIAEKLNISVKAVEKRMTKALAFLRKVLST